MSRRYFVGLHRTAKYGDGCGIRIPVYHFSNYYVHVPFPYSLLKIITYPFRLHTKYFNVDPYPSRTSTFVFKTNPYPYQCTLNLLRFRIPVPVHVLKYQVKISNAMRQIVSRRRLSNALNITSNVSSITPFIRK